MLERLIDAAPQNARAARRTVTPRSSPRGGDIPHGRRNPAVGHAGRARRSWSMATT